MTPRDDRNRWLAEALGLEQGQSPFPWQIRLLDQFLDGTIPPALDLPTGLGKTAVMAIWLVARACGARLPRRLVYVVDRRAVVDQATGVAEQLRAWVGRNPEVEAALGLERALPISTLRGRHIDNRDWLEDPVSPAIVLGTVDMIGSRLLFEGYGVSRKMRPYHAGLLGTDTLVVLDEAHLVQPFERLAEQLASGHDAAGRPLSPLEPDLNALVPPLRFMSLSATGRNRGGAGSFSLTPEDMAHPVVSRRLSAPKLLSLKETVPAKDLPDALAAHAWALSKEGETSTRILVFCTSRNQAQKVRTNLHKLAPRSDQIATELFVGGRRVHEREAAARWLEDHGFLADSNRRPEQATFVIATAAGEVGVDLDADHAVCDLVAWERMVQRFGRVNRRGDGAATIVIVPATSDDDKEEARRSAAGQLLQLLPSAPGDRFDASPAALTTLKADPRRLALIQQASTPAPLHPPLTRALVEAWAMTSLDGHTGRPEVAPWIRGWPEEEEPASTSVVWREHLPVTDDGRLLPRRDLEIFRDAADPHLSERLEAETRQVVEWLLERIGKLASSTAGNAHQDGARSRDEVVAVVFDSAEGDLALKAGNLTKESRRRIERILQGATLMVNRRLAGLDSGLLDADFDGDAPDVTELDAEGDARVVPFRVRRIVDADDLRPSEGWRIEASIDVGIPDEGSPAWLLVESLANQPAESQEGRSSARRAQLLDEHEEWAEAAARRIATALALPDEFVELLATSARLHDEGKKADCWQRAFNAPHGGKPPYAKTTSRPNIPALNGYRHELGSLPHAESDPRIRAMSPSLRDLCLHLIAAHHGAARPLIRTSGASEPPSQLVRRAQEIALRFSALQKTWGPWGLAWWEALLRAADQQASRRNDQQGEGRG